MQASRTRKDMRDAALAEGVIRNLALFRGAGRQTTRHAASHARLRRLGRGEVILRRGETVPGLLAVAYGSLKTRLPHPHGDELVLSLVGPGETLAEAPALLGRASQLDAVALADSMLVLIPSACVHRLLESDPRFARNLANALAERNHRLLGEVESGMQRGEQRLAAYLESIAQPGPAPGTSSARLPVSKTLLAARLGVKKETLSRLLRRLQARGLIRVARREITILDPAGLRTGAAQD